MATSSVDGPARAAARIAGLAYLLSFAIVVSVNFGIVARLIVGADPAQSARNILAHETLFRVAITGDVVYCLAVFVVTAALYIVLRPVGPMLALLAALGRLVHGVTWLLVTVNLFTALRLLKGPEFARALPPEQLPALARLYLSGFDQYYVGLFFWSLAAAACAGLWLRSGYVPRGLAAFGILASGWCAACTFALFLFPDFPKLVNLWWFDMPMVLFEMAVSFLLLIRGLPAGGPASAGPQGARP